jgi:hypothetical protein
VPFDPFLRGEGYEFCGVAPLFAKQSKAKQTQSKAKQSKRKGKRKGKGKCKFATPPFNQNIASKRGDNIYNI